jgi:type IV pilus assembly protein PilA
MFLQNLRARIGARLNGDSEAGFTLIELLVVMLILGILAAIALPAFFNQKQKANDAKAKETAHSVQVAMETYATENSGAYTGVTNAELHRIEPTIPAAATEEPKVTLSAPAEGGYAITVEAETTGHKFSIDRSTTGALTYPCEPKGQGGCASTGSWAHG